MNEQGGSDRAGKAAREDRKAAVSRIVDRIEGTLGATVAAGLVGVSRALFRRWSDVEDDAQIGVADAAGLPPEHRAALAEYIAGPGYTMAALPAVEADGRASMALHSRAMKAAFSLIEKHAAAISDGSVDRREGADVERACDELIREALLVREVARRAQREGVIGAELRAVEGGKRS